MAIHAKQTIAPGVEEISASTAEPTFRNLNAPFIRLLTRVVLTFLVACTIALGQEPGDRSSTDVTFTFTADIHVTFNGFDDHAGIEQSGAWPLDSPLIYHENPRFDFCTIAFPPIPTMKDLCNQIQLLRKLNHVDSSKWSSVGFPQYGHQTTLRGAGSGIQLPAGLIVGGDLTDCGGGSADVLVGIHEEDCNNDFFTTFETPECSQGAIDGSGGVGCGYPGEELAILKQLFDRHSATNPTPLSFYPVLSGMRNPDYDVPLRYNLYPGLGNHDLGYDKSGDMMDYIRTWSSIQPPGSGYHVTNNDPYSGDYSWDWGKLHILNVGVYAGSGNQSAADDSNYQYDQSTMNWIRADLAKYAHDGRPVIIAQHFGMDPFGWSGAWYLSPTNIQGAKSLWPTIAPYNVIGIYHGHNHGEGLYKFGPDFQWSSSGPVGSGHLAYDIFDSGAGYNQEFLVSHVTATYMDVEATLPGDDFDNSGSTVNFGDTASYPGQYMFTKRLVGAPTLGHTSTVETNDAVATSFQQYNDTYIVGATASGRYTIRKATNEETETLGTGSFNIEPKFLTSYTDATRSYVIVSNGSVVMGYTLNATTTGLVKLWSQPMQVKSMTMAYSPTGTPFLVTVDETGGSVHFQLNAISPQGSPSRRSYAPSSASYADFAQMVSVPTQKGFLLVRYFPSGLAEIYAADFNANDVKFTAQNSESWGADAVYPNAQDYRPNVLIQPVNLSDGTAGILVKSTSCLFYELDGITCQQPNTVDSPYTVHTLTQDQHGTEIAWRGSLGAPASVSDAVAMVPLSPVEGVPQVGMFTSAGTFWRFNVNR